MFTTYTIDGTYGITIEAQAHFYELTIEKMQRKDKPSDAWESSEKFVLRGESLQDLEWLVNGAKLLLEATQQRGLEVKGSCLYGFVGPDADTIRKRDLISDEDVQGLIDLQKWSSEDSRVQVVAPR